MEILESVDPDDVPEGAGRAVRPGLWTGLARRAIADCDQGKVTVVAFKTEEDYKRMRNGVAEIFRKFGYSRRFTVVPEADGGLRVYMGLERKDDPPRLNSHPRRPAASGIRPVRHG